MTETDAATEATTEVVTTTEAATTEQDAPADGQTTQAQPVTDEAVKEDIGATVDSDFDIAAFVGESRISVRYAYYMVVDSYPSYDQDGMYIEVQAPEGYKLLVLKFEVENKTNEDQAVDLIIFIYVWGLSLIILLDLDRSDSPLGGVHVRFIM